MAKILIINKNADYKSSSIKNIDNYENELYKKVLLKKPDDFKKQHSWKCKKNNNGYELVLYAKTNGRSGNENKFEFPPPIDTTLFYGSCIVIKKMGDKLVDLNEDEWVTSYEKFYGGFEDLSKTEQDDDNEEDELDNISPSMKTKTGYLKDGFIIEDGENENENENDNDNNDFDDDDEETDIDNDIILNNDNNTSDDNESYDSDLENDGSELQEEEYIFSDDE